MYGLGEDSHTIHHNERLANKLWPYPVAIRIHTDASQRDIIAFIKANWKIIEQYQKRYFNPKRKTSLKNSKTHVPKKERDAFIYEHRHLSHKRIMTLVREQFGEPLDVGLIGKIISLEEKRRKV